jgi:hypothetical protein
MGKLIFLMTVLGVFSALQAAAATCPGTVVFQDPFTAANANLNVAALDTSTVSIAGGKATIAPTKPSIWRGLIYFTDQYGDASVCTTFNTLATDKLENQDAGVIFWAKDYGSFYAFVASPGVGTFAVLQMVPGATSFAVALPWTASSAIQKVAGAPQSLRVQTKGTQALLFINDQQVGTMTTGAPPVGGGLVGMYGGSSDTSASTLVFTGFTVAIQ